MSLAPRYTSPRSVDTGIPGLTRRQIWTTPTVLSHSAVVLTFAKLYLGPPKEDTIPDLTSRLESTLDVPATLGPRTTEIRLTSITNIQHQLEENRLVIEYETAGGSARSVVVFTNSEAADAMFTMLWRRLGDIVELTPFQADSWDLARVPVAIMVGILVGTGLLAIGLNAAADGWTLPIWLPSWSDWRIVCGLGGAALAVAQVWLYRRLTCPPARLELARRTEALVTIRSGNAS